MKKFALVLVFGFVLAACGSKDGVDAGKDKESAPAAQSCAGASCDPAKQYCLITQVGHYDLTAGKVTYSNRAGQCVSYSGVRDCTALWADAKLRFKSSCSGDNFSSQCDHQDSTSDGVTDVVTCTQIR